MARISNDISPIEMQTAAMVLADSTLKTRLTQDLGTMSSVGVVALEIREDILELLAFWWKILGMKKMVAQFLASCMVVYFGFHGRLLCHSRDEQQHGELHGFH